MISVKVAAGVRIRMRLFANREPNPKCAIFDQLPW